MAEFAYNNAVHASTGVTPFFAMMGRHPRIEEELDQKLKREVPDVPAARERAEQLREMRTQLQARWKEAVQAQARYHDAKSKPRSYRAGDMVWLAGKNIRTTRPNKKLDFKFHRPFRVEAAVGTQSYRLTLPDK